MALAGEGSRLKIKITKNALELQPQQSTGEAIMPALTLDEQLIFDGAVALKKVKILGFRKAVVEEGHFELPHSEPIE